MNVCGKQLHSLQSQLNFVKIANIVRSLLTIKCNKSFNLKIIHHSSAQFSTRKLARMRKKFKIFVHFVRLKSICCISIDFVCRLRIFVCMHATHAAGCCVHIKHAAALLAKRCLPSLFAHVLFKGQTLYTRTELKLPIYHLNSFAVPFQRFVTVFYSEKMAICEVCLI